MEIRYSLRRLLRTPGFTLIAVATLALGIGANTAIFSLINGVLLKRPGGVHQPDRLVAVFTADYSSSPYSTSSWPDYQDFKAQTEVFAQLSAFANPAITVARGDQLDRLNAALVTHEFFAMLGLRPVAGRFFNTTDAGAPLIVLSEHAWRTRFAADYSLVGRSITVNAQPYTVIGIAPAAFAGFSVGARTDAWLPMSAAAHIIGEDIARSGRGDRGLSLLGRLQDAQTVASAQARLDVLRQSLVSAHRDAWVKLNGQPRELTVLSERAARVPPDARGNVFTVFGLLLGAVAFVLLVCCANLANLLIARGAARQNEIAIRYSLGARRSWILRQMLVESALLAGAGGLLGLLLALWTSDLITAFPTRGSFPVFFDTAPDLRVLLFTLGVSALTALLFGSAPALQSSRAGLAGAIKGERTLRASQGRSRLRDSLTAAQVAIALVLAIGAGLIARTLREASVVDVGFDADRVVVASFDLSTQGYDSIRSARLYREVETRLAAHPDVAGVTFARRIPLAHAGGRRNVAVTGYQPSPGEEMEFPFNVVTPGYFELMKVPLVRGRPLQSSDANGIIVNETFARRFWSGQEPLGREVMIGDASFRVVGVARDGKYWSITETARPYFYLPAGSEYNGLIVHAKVRTSVEAVQQAVRAVLRQLDPQLPVLVLDTMEDQMANALLPQRIVGSLVGLFALLAVLLAVIGVYGVTSVLVAQRVPEIGLRIALGARGSDVVRLIVGRAAGVALIGIAAGLVLAAFATRAMTSLLFGVSPLDPVTYFAAALVLASAAIVAGYVPARKALRVDPVTALKQ